jgi:hypothetical protein
MRSRNSGERTSILGLNTHFFAVCNTSSIDKSRRVSNAKMSSTIPETMRSLCIYSYRPPSEFEISTIPTPKITLPNHVLIKVAAGSINPADMEQARGEFKMLITLPQGQEFLSTYKY